VANVLAHLRVFARYFFIQATLYLLDMGIFILLCRLFSFPAVGANIVGKVIASLAAFVAHRFFTFGITGQDQLIRQAASFITLLLINIPISTLLLTLFLRGIAWPEIAKLLADVVTLGINFLLIKKFIFRSSA
jgi:putative flippase GtrA